MNTQSVIATRRSDSGSQSRFRYPKFWVRTSPVLRSISVACLILYLASLNIISAAILLLVGSGGMLVFRMIEVVPLAYKLRRAENAIAHYKVELMARFIRVAIFVALPFLPLGQNVGWATMLVVVGVTVSGFDAIVFWVEANYQRAKRSTIKVER